MPFLAMLRRRLPDEVLGIGERRSGDVHRLHLTVMPHCDFESAAVGGTAGLFTPPTVHTLGEFVGCYRVAPGSSSPSADCAPVSLSPVVAGGGVPL